jgi:hypothetical protein
MSQTPGNAITGAGGFGAGVLRNIGNPMWAAQTLGIVGAGVLSLTVAGKLARPALAVGRFVAPRVLPYVTRPINWAIYNAASEMGDAYDWATGKEMGIAPEISARPWMLPTGVPVMVPFPWFDIKAVSSGGGGGPPVIPNLRRPPPTIEERGELSLHEQGLDPLVWAGLIGAGLEYAKKSKKTKSRKSCPPGYRWNGRRCVKKG